ncbi:MAG: zinc ribbon domain-containing protein [Candidatus Obscuribacterales bacterium]|nr:zinc ribbon domain-containing protein [Candidatus Obscuribacterales bacterium]
MECTICGSKLEPTWTHCPHCGKYKSLLKAFSAADIDSIFEKMLNKVQHSVEQAKRPKQPKQPKQPRQIVVTADYTSGVRSQVFEVIVRQALAGAPWRELCAGPMVVNNIAEDEILAEVERRRKALKSRAAAVETKTETSGKKGQSVAPAKPSLDPEPMSLQSARIQKLVVKLEDFLEKALVEEQQKEDSKKMLLELEDIMRSVVRLETLVNTIQAEIAVNTDLERESRRNIKPFPPPDHGGPHRVDW